MSEKVLGFKEKDIKKEIGEPYYPDFYVVEESKLVSVRLASESVDLEKLKKFCERNRMNLLIYRNEKRQEGILLKDLLSWAEKEAGEN